MLYPVCMFLDRCVLFPRGAVSRVRMAVYVLFFSQGAAMFCNTVRIFRPRPCTIKQMRLPLLCTRAS